MPANVANSGRPRLPSASIAVFVIQLFCAIADYNAGHGKQPHRPQRRRIFRKLDPRTQGAGAGPATARHVHPHRQPVARHPGGAGQLGRRGAGRARQEDPRHPACRRLGVGGRRRPRHSVRPAPGRKRAGARTGVHPAARRRQVRQGQGRRLQLFRWPARRRCQRDQRAGQAARGHLLPRGQGGAHGVCRRRRDRAPAGARGRRRRAPQRHRGAGLAGRQSTSRPAPFRCPSCCTCCAARRC